MDELNQSQSSETSTSNSDGRKKELVLKRRSREDLEDFIIGMVTIGTPFSHFESEPFKKYMLTEAKQLGVSFTREGVKNLLVQRYQKIKVNIIQDLHNRMVFF